MQRTEAMKEKANKLIQMTKEQHINSLNSEMAPVFNMLNSKPKGSLPENVFASYFLPYFSGITPIMPESTVIADWISIAGAPTNEVDIVDQTGRVIFTVPPLFDTGVIDTTRDSGRFISIYDQYTLQNTNIPSLANNFLMNALANKASEIDTSVQPVDTWLAILKRYGIEPQGVQSTKVTEEDKEDLLYD